MTNLDKIKRVFEFRSHTIEHLELTVDPEGLSRKDTDIELKTYLGKCWTLSDDEKTGIVHLLCRIQSDSEDQNAAALALSLRLQGFFGFNDEDDLPVDIKRELLGRNAVSVLFPYLRAAISTITQAAGIQPIVLPVINPTAIEGIGHSLPDSERSADDSQ